MPRNGSRVIESRCDIESSRGSSSGSGMAALICSCSPAMRKPMMIADSRTTNPIDSSSSDHQALTSTTNAAPWAKMR